MAQAIHPELFRLVIAEAPSPATMTLVDSGGGTYQTVRIEGGGLSRDYALIDSVAQSDLDLGLVEIRIDLADPAARDRWRDQGLCGLEFDSTVELSAARLVVRSAERPDGYSSEHPFFAIYLDWVLDAAAAAGTQWSNGQASSQVQLALPLTTGFSYIHPPGAQAADLQHFQFRLDLDCIGATTGWLTLPKIGIGIDLPNIDNWFRWLAGIDIGLPFPDWTVTLPLIPAVPLGIGFKKAELGLTKVGGGFQLRASAETLQLKWRGESILEYDDLKASLVYDSASQRYALTVQLVEAHYPEDGASTAHDTLSLPYGALTLDCACWRLRFGLFAHSLTGGGTKLCPELIVEIGGIALRSDWASSALWEAKAVRLHVRAASVLTCIVTGAGSLFDERAGSAFDPYRVQLDSHKLTDVWPSDTTPPAEDPAIEFIDGAIDGNAHLLLLWKQDGDRLLHKFLQAIRYLKSDAAEPVSGVRTAVALELTRFGSDQQLRLEWRPDGPASQPGPPQPAMPDAAGNAICADVQNGQIVLAIPPGSPVPAPVVERDLAVTLPGVEVVLARPQMRSLLFYKTADTWAVSLLHGYDATARTIAGASLRALSFLTDGMQGTSDATPALPKDQAAPFAQAILASTGQWQTLSVLSWQKGKLPNTLQAFDGDGGAFEPLFPDDAGQGGGDCSGCPEPAAKPSRIPLAMPPSRFRAPKLDPAHGWKFHMAAQAASDLFKDKGGATGPVGFDISKICYLPDERVLDIHARLSINFLAKSVEGAVTLRFDPSDMSIRLVGDAKLGIKLDVQQVPAELLERFKMPAGKEYWFSKPVEFLGLDVYLYREKKDGDGQPMQLPFLALDISGGRLAIGLNEEEGLHCGAVLTCAAIGKEIDELLLFDVDELLIGSGGLDLKAKFIASQFKVGTLDKPFSLNEASLEIVGSRMRHLAIGASGQLPDIMGSAPIRLMVGLKQNAAGSIVLDEVVCELVDKDKPIFTSGVRFRFEISKLELRYKDAAEGRQFFFEVSGKAKFVPEIGEFTDGLLENLKEATIEFNRAPLSDKVIDHLELSVELREPVVFDVFHVFRMEIRSLGFAPKHDFSGTGEEGRMRTALIIGGQCKFADTGDVISAEIDFHKLYLGLPARDSSMPQVEFKGLRVEIQSAEGFRIGGSVVSIDEPDRKGFKGDAVISIPGLPQLGAAVGFMQLRLADGRWVRAWFIAVEAAKISYQIPPLPIYLRQIGLGFGYRMVPVIVQDQQDGQTLAEFIEQMMAAFDKHQTLARQESWTEDPEQPGEPARWAVALEGVLTLGTTQGQGAPYKPADEKELRTIVVQMLGAMRSDLTLITAARAWLPVSVDDFFTDRESMRQRALVKGFIHYSPRQQRLLAYATKGTNVYYGPKDDDLTKIWKLILDPVPFEFAAVIEPNRVRGEIGWVDRLVFPLRLGTIDIECRGGILFAIEQRQVVHGLYFSARGRLRLSGGAGGGSLGLRVSAEAKIKFATRLLLAQHMLLPVPSKIYGQAAIDINVVFSVEAWFRFKVGFVKVSLSLSFSFSVQILVTVEFGWAGGGDLGFKGRARVGISVFGRTLQASVAVGVSEGSVDAARRVMAPFLSSILDPGKIPPVPGEVRQAALATSPAFLAGLAEENPSPDPNSEPFAFAVIDAASPGSGERWILWIVPTPKDGAFYPVPALGEAKMPYATINGLSVSAGTTLRAFADGKLTPITGSSVVLESTAGKTFTATSEDGGEGGSLTFREMLAGCYMPNTPDPYFPYDFDGNSVPLIKVDASATDTNQLADERIVIGPRHADPEFNPHHPYDAALKEEAAATEPAAESPTERALGNQAFLMQRFQDDAKWLKDALKTGATIEKDKAEPSLFDLGMVLVVDGPLPDWALKRQNVSHPSIAFAADVVFPADHQSHQTSGLKPIVEPRSIRFADGGVRLAADPIAHFDDDMLAMQWTIEWSDKPTELPVGISDKVTDYLSHYRVEIFDLGNASEKPLLVRDVLPLPRLLASGVRLAPRYCMTVPTPELFPPQLKDSGVDQQVLVVVTPVSQAGDQAAPFTIVAQRASNLTPLPVEQAELELNWHGGKGFDATLTWVQPPMPSKPGIAAPTDWEVVIRKLPDRPIGHYPLATPALEGDAGRLSVDRSSRPGDLIMRVDQHLGRQGPEDVAHGLRGGDRYRIVLPEMGASAEWFDAAGNEIGTTGELAKLRKAFLDRNPSYSWQLFIRSRTAVGERSTYSSLSSVRLFARIGKQVARSDGATGRDRIVLGHFEWPEEKPLPEWPGAGDGKAWLRRPETSTGELHVPVFAHADDIDDWGVHYRRVGDGRRAVTIAWSGFYEEGERLERLAGFRILEAAAETLLNADQNFGAKDFEPAWVEITRFDATDHELAGQAPATLNDTKNWQAWSPRFSARLRGETVPEAGLLAWPAALDRSAFPHVDPMPDGSEAPWGSLIAGRRLHAALDWFIRKLNREASAEDWELSVATGLPLAGVGTVWDWMDRLAPVDDPFGWAALWQIGLGAELSMRHKHTGRAMPQRDLTKICNRIFDDFRQSHPQLWNKFAGHLMLDLPIRPADSILAKEAVRALADVALDRIQMSLRPRIGPVAVSSRKADTSISAFIGLINTASWPWPAVIGADGKPQDPVSSDDQKKEVANRYAAWSRRFHAIAPLERDFARVFEKANVATVAPLAETVEALCADREGKYIFTREVTAKWSIDRLVRVIPQGRYDRLLAAMTRREVAFEPNQLAAAAGYHLPRIRVLEPPQMLWERIVRDAGRTEYHEVGFARHAEAALSAANRPARRQLEYLGTLRRYRRRFLDHEWATRLTDKPRVALPVPVIESAEPGWEPDFASDDKSLLEGQPALRFGARSYLTPAEPFFYSTSLKLKSAAVAVESVELSIELLRTEARPTLAEGDPEFVDAEGPAGDIWPDRQQSFDDWRAALSADHPAREWLRVQSRQVGVRVPRYFESLEEPCRSRERVDQTVGMLPDLGATLQFSLDEQGWDENFAAVRPDPSASDSFTLVQVGPDILVDNLAVRVPTTWWEGVHVSFTYARGEIAVPFGRGRPVVPRDPIDLAGWVLGHLPASGPLSQSAPLALRLEATDELVTLANPFRANRALVRPLTVAPDEAGASEVALRDEVLIGLRLLIDPERLAAAVALGERQPDTTWQEVADAIESAPAVQVRRAVPTIGAALWNRMTESLVVWTRAAGGGWAAADPASPPAAGRELIVGAEALTDDARAAFAAFAAHAGDNGDPLRVRSLVEIEALADVAASLADRFVDAAVPRAVKAWVQHGNRKRVPWGGSR